MGLFSFLSTRKLDAAVGIGDLGSQLAKVRLSTGVREKFQTALQARLSPIQAEATTFTTQSEQIKKISTEISSLEASLSETKDKDHKNVLKGQIKAKESEILNLEMNNFKSLLSLIGNLQALAKATGLKKPEARLNECEAGVKQAIWDLTLTLEKKLKPLAPNSIFTLIGKMAEKELEAAYACAKAVPEEPYRSWSLSEVAERAAVTDPQRGLDIISEITDPNAKLLAYSKLMTKVLSARLEDLDNQSARRIAEQIQDENARQWAMVKIAQRK
jgi:hypothetical protein